MWSRAAAEGAHRLSPLLPYRFGYGFDVFGKTRDILKPFPFDVTPRILVMYFVVFFIFEMYIRLLVPYSNN